MYKLFRYFTIVFLLLTLVSWGSVGHSIINRKSAESFPVSMTGFGVWADSLSIHASDADSRKGTDSNESPKHFIDIDNYSEFIRTGRIASTYDSLVALHGSPTVISNGTLPYATKNTYDSLKLAFKQLNWHKAMLLSSDLGHYVGDGQMPLHLTANYDGQKTNQSGVHSRYESTMVSAYSTNLASYTGISATLVPNVNKYIFDYIYKNQHYVDSVLQADIYASSLAGNTQSSQYTAALWSKSQFTITLFRNASRALADLIFSAWTEAGKPAFGTKKITENISPKLYSFTISPNPVTNKLFIGVNDISDGHIFSTDGKKIKEFNSNSVSVTNLNPGIYFVRIQTTDNNIYISKFIVKK